MGMGMGMSMSLSQSQRQEMRVSISLPAIQWSLIRAYEEDKKEGFVFPLTIKKKRLEGFENLDHVTQLQKIDEANTIFRFVYTRGEDEWGDAEGYYKIPLLREVGWEEELEDLAIEITKEEYERATTILGSVGEMERIGRAIPYHGLYTEVTSHLAECGVTAADVVLVGVDRGGRLPALVMQRVFKTREVFFLKVDQGGGCLDMARINEFADKGVFRNRHVLFVDSTVDSGRQINVLGQYFDDPGWQQRLGHRSWSIVGSNDHQKNLYRHRNINWGVDPDATFEDDPKLMGVDYAPGSTTKVIDVSSETSEAIRRVLFSVPDGYVYDLSGIDDLLRARKEKILVQTGEGDAYLRADRAWERIVQTKTWQNLVLSYRGLPKEPLPTEFQNGQDYAFHNVLVIGDGGTRTLSDEAARFLARALGPHCSVFAGTPKGNPGAVLDALASCPEVPRPELRLYQPAYAEGGEDQYRGQPIVFVGEDKMEFRRRMIQDSDAVLVLGGRTGTLRETIIALEMGKPVVIIQNYGPVARYLAQRKTYRRKANLNVCPTIPDAVRVLLQLPAA